MFHTSFSHHNNIFSQRSSEYPVNEIEEEINLFLNDPTVHSWDYEDDLSVEEQTISQQPVFKPRPCRSNVRGISSTLHDDNDDLAGLWDDDDYKRIFSQNIELTLSTDSALDTPFFWQELSTPVIPDNPIIRIEQFVVEASTLCDSPTAHVELGKAQSGFSETEKVNLMIPSLTRGIDLGKIATVDTSDQCDEIRRVSLDSKNENLRPRVKRGNRFQSVHASPSSVARLEVEGVLFSSNDLHKTRKDVAECDQSKTSRKRPAKHDCRQTTKIPRLDPKTLRFQRCVDSFVPSIVCGVFSLEEIKRILEEKEVSPLVYMALEKRVPEVMHMLREYAVRRARLDSQKVIPSSSRSVKYQLR